MRRRQRRRRIGHAVAGGETALRPWGMRRRECVRWVSRRRRRSRGRRRRGQGRVVGRGRGRGRGERVVSRRDWQASVFGLGHRFRFRHARLCQLWGRCSRPITSRPLPPIQISMGDLAAAYRIWCIPLPSIIIQRPAYITTTITNPGWKVLRSPRAAGALHSLLRQPQSQYDGACPAQSPSSSRSPSSQLAPPLAPFSRSCNTI